MKDVTSIFKNYRECARHLRNTYFPAKGSFEEAWDIIDDFKEIDGQLFQSLVLKKLKPFTWEKLFKEPIPFLQILPSSPTIPILINRPSDDRNWYWDDPINSLSQGDAELHFIGFFDWDQIEQPDWEYYRVRIFGFSKHSRLVGRDALIKTNHANVLFKDD